MSDGPEPYRGSLDPFQDMAEQCKRLDVAFCIIIGTVGSPVTNVWCNGSDFGPRGLANMEHAFRTEMAKQRELLDE